MRRGLRWALAPAGLALVAAGAVALWPEPPSRVTRENFDRVKDGMTESEVIAILGAPGDFRTKDSEYIVASLLIDRRPRLIDREWVTDTHVARVGLEPACGAVAERFFDDVFPIEQSLWDDLCGRAIRQWRRWFP